MAFAFDTLGFSKKLRDKGIQQPEAEAHAEAVWDFVMAELVTKTDLIAALETQTLRLTIRLGLMLGGAIALLGAILKLT
jgi:hypothetical protein